MLLLLSALLPLLTFCAVAPAPSQQPHYVDGTHNAAYEESQEAKWLHSSCQQLQDEFPAGWKRAMPAYEASPSDEEISREVMQLQRPESCERARLLLFSLHSDCGWGAEMHWLTVAMYAAMETKRTLVLLEHKKWIYASEPFCKKGEGTFSCFFEPISSCTVFKDEDLKAILGEQSLKDVPVFSTKDLHALDDERVVQYSTDLQQQLDFKFFRSIPTKYKEQKKDLFWFRSQLIHALLVLQPRVEEHVAQRRVDLGINQLDLLGVHARRGDKALGSAINNSEMDPVSYDTIFGISKAFAINCGFDGVYTATKDPKYLAYIQERIAAGDGGGLKWISDDDMARRDEGWSTYNLLKGKLDNSKECLDVITDVHLLASMRGFLGSYESNLSRLVAEKAFAGYEMEFTGAFRGPWITFP